MPNTLTDQLKAATDPTEKKALILKKIEQFAEEFASQLGLMADEVAIQLIVGHGHSLKFLYPQVLYESGATFPISTNSIAGSAVMMKKECFINKTSNMKHLLFFEKLNTGVRAPLPIQKMATIPIIVDNTVMGIVQMSRRAKSFEEAGADFTSADVEKASSLLSELGVLFKMHVFEQM